MGDAGQQQQMQCCMWVYSDAHSNYALNNTGFDRFIRENDVSVR